MAPSGCCCDTSVSIQPFPELRDLPASPGEYLTFFDADVPSSRIDAKSGRLVLNVSVVVDDKYWAMPITDIRGKRLRFAVYAPRGRKDITRAGRLAVYDMRENRATRRQQREWAKVRAAYFEGVDG